MNKSPGSVSPIPDARYRLLMIAFLPPWPESVYRFELADPVFEEASEVAKAVFRRAWRTTLEEPGFAVVRFASPLSSAVLRRVMLTIVESMPLRFRPERLGRFDQQVTSRFHRDGAPAASLLLLGYEPSPVRSRFFVADAHRAASTDGLGIAEWLTTYNPMAARGEEKLRPFVTELELPNREPFIVAINNSLLPFRPGSAVPLGLLHRAEVPNPDPAATRVINSMGLMLAGDSSYTPLDSAAVERFLTRDDLD